MKLFEESYRMYVGSENRIKHMNVLDAKELNFAKVDLTIHAGGCGNANGNICGNGNANGNGCLAAESAFVIDSAD